MSLSPASSELGLLRSRSEGTRSSHQWKVDVQTPCAFSSAPLSLPRDGGGIAVSEAS